MIALSIFETVYMQVQKRRKNRFGFRWDGNFIDDILVMDLAHILSISIELLYDSHELNWICSILFIRSFVFLPFVDFMVHSAKVSFIAI